ncbi:putative glycosyl hydrolase [Desulfitobacterium dichloroeliminans LMG P-21439]|uniref:Putative glycosyl hydrolase n=1 Tax=Desulfitobacterium dichloroeliminans (strain LMG P-21439 / DCA1) TaxID=871963 RepID=L0FCU5_DESDL|nr:glycosyl hydrolase family 18 protein [Desulfitobacterium dichloroeliminans]AGA70773.1 putative glycosyl hydrolase [Desulfitobacterium dichloroeliminans LMG P-21439]
MRILRRGSRGSDVSEVQARLSELGYLPGPVDGIFGVRTEAAVKQFQRDRGLVPDGIVGPLTYNALFQPGPQPDYILYTIKAGDTFYKLSLSYGVSVDEIIAANPGVNPYQLRIGQRIRIPKAPGKRHTFSAWVPYWAQQEAMAVVRQHAELITTLSPFWYELTPTGDLIVYPNGEDSSLIEFTRSQGIALIPLIANNFNRQLVSTMLNNPTVRQHHITTIVNKVRTMNYEGIEIDYENIAAADRYLFVEFLRELKAALAPDNKKLYVAIQAKTRADEPGSSAGHDYPGIGSAVDVVRLMLYDYSWDTPGSIAPASWIRQVLDYAVTVIPRAKLEAGLPTYGYDWGTNRSSVTYDAAIRLAQQHQVQIIQDPQNGPHFSYTDNGVSHQVWFTNAVNFATFVDIVNEYNIRGISIWHPGGDDPQIYTVIQDRLQ